MSWILITTLMIFVLCGFAGWRKGIIQIVVSIAALIICILATAFLSPIVAETLKKNTQIYDKLCESMYQAISSNEEVNQVVDDTMENQADISLSEGELNRYESMIDSCLDKINQVVNLPDQYGSKLSEISTDKYFAGLLDGQETVKNIVTRAFAIRLADLIFQAMIYVIIFVIIYIILRIVVLATGLIAKLPVIHGANKVLGLAFGLVEGLLIVWLLYTILTAMSGSEYISTALSDINHNGMLKYLYDNNVIMKMIYR